MSTPVPKWAVYSVEEFDSQDTLDAVAEEWKDLAGEDEFEVEAGSLFEWCGDHMTPVEGDGHAMRVRNDSNGRTDAILEMVNGKRGAVSKLLRLFVSPEFWPADRDLEVRDRFEDLYTGIFVKVISAGMLADEVVEIRIYGRTDLMYAMLKSLSEGWTTIEEVSWSATIEGRWLSLTSNGK